MSVTLKMADHDAALVAGILLDVCKIQEASIKQEPTVHVNAVKALDRRVSSSVILNQVRQIAGAFEVAVRANQR